MAQAKSTSWCSGRIPTTSKSGWAARSRVTRRRAIASASAISRKASSRATARWSSGRRKPRPPRVLGAAWRENLGWPDGGIATIPGADSFRGRSAPPASAPHDRHPVLGRPAPGPCRRQPRAACRRVQKRAGALRHRRAAVAPRLGLLLLHQRRRHAVVCRRRVGPLPAQSARPSPVTRASSRPAVPTPSPRA